MTVAAGRETTIEPQGAPAPNGTANATTPAGRATANAPTGPAGAGTATDLADAAARTGRAGPTAPTGPAAAGERTGPAATPAQRGRATAAAQRASTTAAAGQQPTAAAAPTAGAAAPTGATARAGAAGQARGGTFASLRIPNYRRYMLGQTISWCGRWTQIIALGWLVLSLGASGTVLGAVTAAQFVPVLLFGPYGGLVADRYNSRHLLITTNAMVGVLATVLGLLVVTDVVRLWMVVVYAVCFGAIQALDNPARQTFVPEIVDPATLPNAVSLNSVVTNAARIIGPGIAGAVIALAGTGACFLLTGLTTVAVVLTLTRMDTAALRPAPQVARAPGQIREGFAYAMRTQAIRIPLLMMVITGMLTYEFNVVLPLVARETFHGDAGTYSLLTGAMGAGAVAGGLGVARWRLTGARALVTISATFAALLLLAAIAPTLPLAVAALVATGAASVALIATGSSTVQMAAEPRMRGRVMALWTMTFLGTTPLGGPIAGWVSEAFGARYGLVLAAAAAAVAAALGLASLRRSEHAPAVAAAPSLAND
ncbi:MAG: MFS transporter [Frankia sp.]|nr:MFS transporter [Frankia sp.]